MVTRKLLSVIDNIVVDVLKIICCSESTDSFMANTTVAQLPGHSRGTRFGPGCPPSPWRRHCRRRRQSYQIDTDITARWIR